MVPRERQGRSKRTSGKETSGERSEERTKGVATATGRGIKGETSEKRQDFSWPRRLEDEEKTGGVPGTETKKRSQEYSTRPIVL